ncbi:MAG: hypothetical protein QOJ95_4505 [Mycobacterium sp.]|jgi:GAF domain-containing protein|nr:hypothetical protein [Mycobacterium sp.]
MTAKSRAGVAKLLGDLAVRMQDQPDTELTLQAIVEGAVAIVPGTRWAGISLVTGRRVIPRVPSAPLVAKLDCLQTALDDGPCISALREYHTVLIDDTSAESRWPRFSEAAAGLGVDSVLSFQLFVESENLGSLNLYSDEAGVFDEDAIFLGQLVAQHASVALVGSAAQTQFRDAVSSRDAIGQAKGILMHRERLAGVDAFALLVKTSQNANIKVIDLARFIIEQHEAELQEGAV